MRAGRILISCAAFGVACSSCGSDGVAPGGISDATSLAESEVGVDTAPVGGEVGSLIDVASDAPDGSPLARGTWAGLAIYPDCPPAIAVDPAVAITPLQWVACSSGRPDCRVLKIDWNTRTDDGPVRKPTGYPAVRIVAGRPYVNLGRYSRDWFTRVIQDGFDGPAVFASTFGPYAPLSCIVGGSVGPAGLVLSGGVSGKDRPLSVDKYLIVGSATWGAFDKPNLRLAERAEFGAVTESGGLNSMVVGDRIAFSSSYLPTSAQPFSLATLKPTRSLNHASVPVAVPDGVLARDLDTFGLLLVRDDGSHGPWTAPEKWPGKVRVIAWHDFDQTSRDTLVWTECTAETGADPVLWAANYSPDPTKVNRRKIGALPATTASGGRGMVLNGGHVLIATAADRAAIYRLSDGVGWSLVAEGGTEFEEPLWLDESELFVLTKKPGEKPSNILGSPRGLMEASPRDHATVREDSQAIAS